ncbi:MAG: hypothetical protein P1U63_00210 [Coxiellaceae bacterium]|nr:hypothetical protein [Coxiellaceae bacterium]
MRNETARSTPSRRQLGRYIVNASLFIAAAAITAATTYMLSRIFRVTANEIQHSPYSLSMIFFTNKNLLFGLDPQLVASEANTVTPNCQWLIKQRAYVKGMHTLPTHQRFYNDNERILSGCVRAMNNIHRFVKHKMGDHLALIHNSVLAGYIISGVLGLLSVANYARYKHAPKPTAPLEQIIIEPAFLT